MANGFHSPKSKTNWDSVNHALLPASRVANFSASAFVGIILFAIQHSAALSFDRLYFTTTAPTIFGPA